MSPRILLIVASCLAVATCSDSPVMNKPIGNASIESEATIVLPSKNRLQAVADASVTLIASGDFPSADDFAASAIGLFTSGSDLILQIGGGEAADRDYKAFAMAREIPGILEFSEDADSWWPTRGEDNPLLKVMAGAIAQELYTEQMHGP